MVGSGATWGWAAKELTETGIRVALLESTGATEIKLRSNLARFGDAIHEAGSAHMGNDPGTSVLNQGCQAHDVKILLVPDGDCFVTSANQNPTLTMMASTSRACDHLVEQYCKGEL